MDFKITTLDIHELVEHLYYGYGSFTSIDNKVLVSLGLRIISNGVYIKLYEIHKIVFGWQKYSQDTLIAELINTGDKERDWKLFDKEFKKNIKEINAIKEGLLFIS